MRLLSVFVCVYVCVVIKPMILFVYGESAAAAANSHQVART